MILYDTGEFSYSKVSLFRAKPPPRPFLLVGFNGVREGQHTAGLRPLSQLLANEIHMVINLSVKVKSQLPLRFCSRLR